MKLLYLIKFCIVFVKHLLLLFYVGNCSIEKIRRMQYKKINDLIYYSWNNVPFYQKYWKENGFEPNMFKSLDDIQLIPFIDKNTIRNNFEEFLPMAYNRNRLSIVTTGGTTGMPMSFYCDKVLAKSKELAYIFIYNYKMFGIKRVWDRSIVIRGYKINENLINEKIYWRYSKNRNALIMSSFHINSESVYGYVEAINKFNPKHIFAYPSSLVSLCSTMKKNGLKLKVKIDRIVTSSENIYDWQRDLVREVLDAEIYSFYGHGEKCVIAYQSMRCSNMHFNPFYGYTEFLNENGNHCSYRGERGEIVVTSFDNTYYPFIRYRTNDIIEYDGSVCSCCGMPALSAKKLVGRISDVVFNADNSVSVFTFSDVVFNDLKKITAYQYQQDEPGKMILRYESENELLNSELIHLYSELDKYFPNIEFSLEHVLHISRTGSGKFRYLIQNIKNKY